LALILSSILPVIAIIIGGGGKMVAKASRRVLTYYASAATTAEEILSSVRTVQAFSTQEKLASVYDTNLKRAQKAGYRKAYALALLQASLFGASYLLYGLAFCTFPLCGY
jgi:ATP-binding cassette subfamily B (MDR/TAP) protein 1